MTNYDTKCRSGTQMLLSENSKSEAVLSLLTRSKLMSRSLGFKLAGRPSRKHFREKKGKVRQTENKQD